MRWVVWLPARADENFAGPVGLTLSVAGITYQHSPLTFTYYVQPQVLRIRSRCRFVILFIHFMPNSLR
jgi:hypothetical protein